MKEKILVLADWYEPGFKAGGPIRSCVNFTGYMKEDYDIYVMTGDRDLGDKQPYNNIEANKWVCREGVNIYYAGPSMIGWSLLLAQIRNIQPDFIYLNSLFSKYFSIYPLLMKRLGRIDGKIILAPRGMLRESALQFKKSKKKVFLRTLRGLKMQHLVTFHATDATEQNDVKTHFGKQADVKMISNFPGIQKELLIPPDKKRGAVKLIFVGRVHPIKNLHLLLESLLPVKEEVQLTIVAAIEDMAYWEHCNKIIQSFPASISVELMSDVPHHELEAVLLQHHLFCLPTKGENFGHAIFEALTAGRPVSISDQTPWRNLAPANAGWDLPLQEPSAFTAVIEQVAAMSKEELAIWCKGAWQYAYDFIHGSNIKAQYLNLFKI